MLNLQSRLGIFAATGALLMSQGLGVLAATPAKPAAKPSPSPSPSPSPKCSIPAGMEFDPQEKKLYDQCLAQMKAISDQKGKLSDSLALANGSLESLQQMLQQTRDAEEANKKHQAELQTQIKALEGQQEVTRRQMEETRRQLAQRRAQYSGFLRHSYETQPNMVSFIFSSNGLADFLRRATAVTQVRAYGRDLLRRIHDQEEQLQRQADQIKADHQAAQDKKAALIKSQEELVAAAVREQAIVIQLQSSISDSQHELVNADGQSADLVARMVAAQVERMDELIRMANDAAWAAAQAWMQSNNATFTPSTGHTTKYPFLWPAQKGVISQGFGPTDFAPEPPGFGAAHFHAGVDVANNAGTPILAADDGVVASATESMINGHMIGYGRHVIIAHKNGMMTLYGHLDGYVVKVGDQVKQGDVIGVMGSTGNSSGPHLHFELRINNVPTDPMPYLPPNGPNDFRQ